VQEAIESEPGGAHSIAGLARRGAMSPRHFTRVFTGEVGVAPGAYVERIRTEAARRQLEETDGTVIAARRGFDTAETMRRSFVRRLASPRPVPQDLRLTQRRSTMPQNAIVLYPGYTAPDVIGPYKALRNLPDTEVRFVWHEPGPITAHPGVLIVGATHSFEPDMSASAAPRQAVRGTHPGESGRCE
jgi:AraC-like DNA-binding protein